MSKKEKQSKPLIEDTRPYVLWRRVSTKKQGKSELGLDAQLTYAREFTRKEPLEVFTDVWSGQKLEECKGLWEAIDFCKESGAFLLIAKTDRFRNVEQACRVLRAVGSNNLKFCDLPECNEMVLKIMWAVWESQAKMGQINTKRAMDEIKRKIETEGGFMTRDGRWCEHIGRSKGCDLSVAQRAGGAAMMRKAQAYRSKSAGYIFVSREVLKGTPRNKIIEQFNEMHEQYPDVFCTSQGKPLSKGILSRWVSEILQKN